MRIIDIRETTEFEKYHIPDSLNMPFSNFESLAKTYFTQHPTQEILLICRSGRRAMDAMDLLLDWDLTEEEHITVYHGGLLRWLDEGKEIVKK